MKAMPEPLSLYVHVPFCTTRCAYCDFNTYAGQEALILPYVAALRTEMRLWGKAVRGRTVETVFFGGGTPSLLRLPELEGLFETLADVFAVRSGAEVTLEANPGTVSRGYLQALRKLGVNRLSLGAQSFDDSDLRWLGRSHSAADVRRNVRAARAAGFENLNLDLIFGLPGQTIGSWERSLQEALALGPEHLSVYALTVEDGTPLARDVARGRTAPPDPDLQADLYLRAAELLDRAGYQQYEISNWAIPGFDCRHNVRYWENGEWLGLGAGAHSHLNGARFSVERLPARYIEKVSAAAAAGAERLEQMGQVVWVERPDRTAAMADTVILGLRLVDGVDLMAFERRFGVDVRRRFADAIESGVRDGLLEVTADRLRLTPGSRLVANEALVRFLLASRAPSSAQPSD